MPSVLSTYSAQPVGLSTMKKLFGRDKSKLPKVAPLRTDIPKEYQEQPHRDYPLHVSHSAREDRWKVVSKPPGDEESVQPHYPLHVSHSAREDRWKVVSKPPGDEESIQPPSSSHSRSYISSPPGSGPLHVSPHTPRSTFGMISSTPQYPHSHPSSTKPDRERREKESTHALRKRPLSPTPGASGTLSSLAAQLPNSTLTLTEEYILPDTLFKWGAKDKSKEKEREKEKERPSQREGRGREWAAQLPNSAPTPTDEYMLPDILSDLFGGKDKSKEKEREKEKERPSRDPEREREGRGREWESEREWTEEGGYELTRMIGDSTASSVENWSLALEICERSSANESNAKEAATALRKEFKCGKPTTQLSAARLWAIMLRHCSEIFIMQCMFKKFLETLEDVLTSSKTNPVVKDRIMEVLAPASYAQQIIGPRGDREGFRGLWRKLKRPDQPEEGIPFDTADELFTPPPYPRRGAFLTYDATEQNPQTNNARDMSPPHPSNPTPSKASPKNKRKPSPAIIPPEENIRRLFHECMIGEGNAALLAEALAFAKPEDLTKEGGIIKEFYSKCCASQELIFAQIPWATAGVERSRIERGLPAKGIAHSDLVSSDDAPKEVTVEEQLLATLLTANENLLEKLSLHRDMEMIAIERMAGERVSVDRSHLQYRNSDGSFHNGHLSNFGVISSQSPSLTGPGPSSRSGDGDHTSIPAPLRAGPPPPYSPAMYHSKSQASETESPPPTRNLFTPGRSQTMGFPKHDTKSQSDPANPPSMSLISRESIDIHTSPPTTNTNRPSDQLDRIVDSAKFVSGHDEGLMIESPLTKMEEFSDQEAFIDPTETRVYKTLATLIKSKILKSGSDPIVLGRFRKLVDDMCRKDDVASLAASSQYRRHLQEMANELKCYAEHIVNALKVDDEELTHLLYCIPDSITKEKRALELIGTEAECFTNLLSDTLRSNATWPPAAQRLLQKLYQKSESLPPGLFLNGVERRGEVVAVGGFADIFKGRLDGDDVAIKRLRLYVSEEPKVRKDLIVEVSTWQNLKHPHVLPFLGLHLQGSLPCIVTPWMYHGTILKYLQTNTPHIERLVLEIAKGLEYLHNRNIIHGDLRGTNILVDNKGHARLADFGLATFSDATLSSQSKTNPRGSTRWMAPELLDYKEPSRKTKASDIFALACLYWEIYTQKVPFSEVKMDFTIRQKIINRERPERPPAISDFNWNVIEECWAHEPKSRPNLETVLGQMRDNDFGVDL